MSTRHQDKSNPAGAVKNLINAEPSIAVSQFGWHACRGAVVEYLSYSPSRNAHLVQF